MAVYTALILIFFLFAFYKYIKYKHNFWARLGVVSPNPTSLFGNFTESWLGSLNQIELLENLYQKFKDTSRILGVYQLLTPQLLILDPQIVKDIFVTHFNNFQDTSFGNIIDPKVDPLLARNPFFLSGQNWKDKRAEITPAFSPARVKAMFPLVEEVCSRMEEYLKSKSNQILEARDLCSRFTCDVASNCIFAVNAGSFVHEKPKVWTMAKQIFKNDVVEVLRFQVLMFLPFVAKLLGMGFVPQKIQNFFIDLMSQAAEQRRRSGNTQQDYLDYILKMQEKKNDSNIELAANAITFFTDGFDTSSLAISCVLYELAKNKTEQTRLRRELEQISDIDQIVEHDYLEKVFAEGLRMHPPGGFLARECTVPIDVNWLNNDKSLHINKGDLVLVPVWSIHYDERIYDDPYRFNPNRFSNDSLKQLTADGLYIGFGLGPRACIGKRFARMQAKMCIARIVKNFEVVVDSRTILPLKIDPKELLTYYSGGLWLRFNKV